MKKKRTLLRTGRNLTLLAVCSLIGLASGNSIAQLADDPVPKSIPPGFKVKLVDVAGGLTAPNLGVNVPGHDDLLMVSDQNGIIWLVDVTGSNNKMLFLDLSSQLVPLGVFGPNFFRRTWIARASGSPTVSDQRPFLYPHIGAIGTYG